MTTAISSTDVFHTKSDEMRLEIFCLVWLDAGSSIKDGHDTEQQLRSIINHLKKFQDVKQCQKYIEERSQKERVVMVVSGQLGREIVPSIHNLRQVISIYVYCLDKKRNEQWACVGAGNSTTSLNGEFVFSQVLIDCLIRLRYTEADKNELIRVCKQQYKGNSVELNNIREFQDKYSSGNVLWWYSRESFFYKTLNAALRTPADIHTIFLFRKYITDIQYQLKNHQAKNPVRVYRSQMISTNELETLKQCCGQFISVNSFFSTSIDKQQALSFLDFPDDTENLEAVLFQIDADPKMAITKPFADITKYSEYKDEAEVLFMLGSIFRLGSVNRSKHGQIWLIQMTLCNNDEHDLKQVLMDMKEQFVSEETSLQTLGKLLWEMGRSDLAGQYFFRMLEQLPPNDSRRIDLYQDLGKLASNAHQLDKSDKATVRELLPTDEQGNVLSDRNELTYIVHVFTGDKYGAGTDANVFLTIYGKSEDTGERELRQSKKNREKFERNQEDIFEIKAASLGKLKQIKIRHDDSNIGSAWYLDRVEIDDPETNQTYHFICQKWLATDKDDGLISREIPALENKALRLAAARESSAGSSVDYGLEMNTHIHRGSYD
ncbi:unnamed protein product [Rotaria sordida]|uniref:PLAT domain-containing protein n=1 Tax=Rotaria sordida TaxID=392033 RepID=A0A815QUT9_9BILA|nr:unnamed protein product [Rotaria sordida]CAF1468135.1 unnamed protein product [Rotaria sordida]